MWKTDILLKNAADGSNLFIAECKFWHGAKHFKESISQLFDRYLTWRDSKVALMVFVKGTNFTTAIESIHKNVVTHEYFVRKTKFGMKLHLITFSDCRKMLIRRFSLRLLHLISTNDRLII